MAEREDPLIGFHFAIDLQDAVKGFFTECSGLGSEQEVIEHKVVTEKGQEVVLKLPGRLKWENITLKRGITSNLDIWKWRGAEHSQRTVIAGIQSVLVLTDFIGPARIVKNTVIRLQCYIGIDQ